MRSQAPRPHILTTLRERAGFPRVADLVRASGVPYSTIYGHERGKVGGLSPRVARLLAGPLGCRWEDLL